VRRTVTDVRGVRWTLRGRQLRGAGTPLPRAGPEEESLRRRLAAALSRLPATASAPVPRNWYLPADTADIEMQATVAAFRDSPMRTGSAPWAVGQAIRLVGEAVAHLRTPRSELWQIELLARGRIRRWARWQVTGADGAAQAVATIAADVAAGRVPEPWGTTLVDVVDQRPPYRPQPVA